MSKSKRLKGRVAVVTGASRGIGRAVALALAREGAHVIITARTIGALEELDDEIRAAGGSATILQLDLRRLDRIDPLGPTLFQRWGKLDILVACAGILGLLSPLPHLSADAWDATLDINLSANWRLIRTLEPLLQRSEGARALFVTCEAARKDEAYWGPLAVSKAALEALVRTYARECERTKVGVALVDPGPVATGLRAKAFPGENTDELARPVDVAPMFVELVAGKALKQGALYQFGDWQGAHQAEEAHASGD